MLVTSKTHHNKCIEYGDCHMGAPGVRRQCFFRSSSNPLAATIYLADMQGGLSLATDNEFRHFLVSSPLSHHLAFNLSAETSRSRIVSHDLNYHNASTGLQYLGLPFSFALTDFLHQTLPYKPCLLHMPAPLRHLAPHNLFA